MPTYTTILGGIYWGVYRDECKEYREVRRELPD